MSPTKTHCPARIAKARAIFGLVALAGGASLLEATEAGAGTLFRERALELGIDFVHFNGMTGKLYLPEIMGGAVAVFDYDDDGDLDVYYGQGALFAGDSMEDATLPSAYPPPLTDRLYRNELVSSSGGGTLRFTDVTETVDLPATGNSMGIAVGDVDNDGLLDLYLANFGPNQLLLGRGAAGFVDRTREAGVGDASWSVAAAFVDIDGDGWQDLVVGNYLDMSEATKKKCSGATGAADYCGPSAYPPLPNRVFRNRGDGTFVDVTDQALVDHRPGATLGLVSSDFDRDGLVDLYVANDMMNNELWINRGDSTFVDDAILSGAAVDLNGLAQASMGIAAWDADGNGAEDLLITHLADEMNTFYLNDGSGSFKDASRESGLGLPSWRQTGFGVASRDFDHDGRVDVFIANGAVKRIAAQMRTDTALPLEEENLFFRGVGPGTFELLEHDRVVDAVQAEVSRGVAVGDLDDDGDLDLVLSNNGGRGRVLINHGAEGPWIGLELIDGGAGKRADPQGAEVTLRWSEGAPVVLRSRRSGSYAASSDARLHHAVGSRGRPVGLEVRWPDGRVERFEAPPLDRYTSVVRGQGRVVDQP